MQFKDVALGRATLGLTVVALTWWVLAPAQAVGALLPGAAAVLQVLRLRGWRSRLSLARPILWILHAAYAWVPLGLACLVALIQ